MSNKLYQTIISDPKIAKYWGQTFLRDELLTDILGSDTHSILYWAGKRMARKYPIDNNDDLIKFFKQTGWGNLSLKKQNKHSYTWQLTSLLIQKRLQVNPDSDFMFEAGFIAQALEQQLEVVSEAEMNPKDNKNGIVTINVHIDPKNKVFDTKEIDNFKIIDSNHHEQQKRNDNENEKNKK